MAIKKKTTNPIENEVKEVAGEGTMSGTYEAPTDVDVDVVVNPSTLLLNGSIKLVSETFGLTDEYTLLKFADGVNNVQLTLASKNFEVTVKVKNDEFYNLKAELGLLD